MRKSRKVIKTVHLTRKEVGQALSDFIYKISGERVCDLEITKVSDDLEINYLEAQSVEVLNH